MRLLGLSARAAKGVCGGRELALVRPNECHSFGTLEARDHGADYGGAAVLGGRELRECRWGVV